jgi:hypothetical protein
VICFHVKLLYGTLAIMVEFLGSDGSGDRVNTCLQESATSVMVSCQALGLSCRRRDRRLEKGGGVRSGVSNACMVLNRDHRVFQFHNQSLLPLSPTSNRLLRQRGKAELTPASLSPLDDADSRTLLLDVGPVGNEAAE